MVVAESEEICDHALKLIGEGIVWEELPFILDPEEAADPGATVLQPEMNAESNIYKDRVSYNTGDVETGFANSDNIIEFSEFKHEDDVWAGVEPGCVVAEFKGDDLEVWYHGQFPGFEYVNLVTPTFKQGVANRSRIKIHTPSNGGSFGGNSMGVLLILPGLLLWLLGKLAKRSRLLTIM
jgi:CO/xanthine dehydrogenase Mo-binding subunit